jgi:hypothetical protein
MAITLTRFANKARTFLKKQEITGRLLAELQDYMEGAALESRSAELSFETGEQGTFKFYFQKAVLINAIKLEVTKALAATDAGTVLAKDSSGNNLAAAASFPASTVLNTEATITPTANNTVAAGGFITLTTAKTTAGGKVRATIQFQANPTLT